MLVHGEKGLLLARIWESKDQRGRSEYPLVAAIHVATGHLPASLEPLWAVLDHFHGQAVAADSQDDVRAAAASTLAQINGAMGQIQPMDEGGLPVGERQQFLSSSAFPAQEVGISRLLYRVSVELKDFLPGRPVVQQTRAFRVPLHADMGGNALLAYNNLIRTQIARSYQVSQIVSPDGSFLDLIVGLLDGQVVRNAKLNLTKLPCITDVPFNIPAETERRIFDAYSTFSAEPVSEVIVIADPSAREKGTSFFGSIINRFSNR